MLGGFLADAYKAAEEFCEEVGKRQGMISGFLKTILLRRAGQHRGGGSRHGAQDARAGPRSPATRDDPEEAPAGSSIR